jgi:hypothetical protein
MNNQLSDEKSRIIQRVIKIIKRKIIIISCHCNDFDWLYCCFRTDLRYFSLSTSCSSIFQRKKLQRKFEKKRLNRNRIYSVRLYKICNHNQENISIREPIGNAKRKKLAKDISN